MSFITIYITHPDEEKASKISTALLEKKLVACANIFPVTSAYWWQENIQKEREWVSLVKTVAENWDAVQSAVAEYHPYEVPCMMKTIVEANEAYENWIRASVKIAKS